MNYGYKMKEIRTYELITQKDMAEILGLKRSTYKEYELQNSIMPIAYIIKFCDYHNVSLDYIFNFTTLLNYTNSSSINLKKSGNRLKVLRISKKLNQSELSKILKYSISTISNYENGKQMISTSFLYTICSKYNISADYLLGKIDTPKYLISTKK